MDKEDGGDMGLIELSLYDRLRRLKANRDLDAVAGNLPIFDENGDLVDSGTDLSDYEPADATILKKADVVDGLESEVTDVPLSANQGKVLKDAQDVLNGDVETEGSVAKAIDDAVSPIDERLSGLDTLVYEGKTYMVSKRIENGHLVTTYTEVI